MDMALFYALLLSMPCRTGFSDVFKRLQVDQIIRSDEEGVTDSMLSGIPSEPLEPLLCKAMTKPSAVVIKVETAAGCRNDGAVIDGHQKRSA